MGKLEDLFKRKISSMLGDDVLVVKNHILDDVEHGLEPFVRLGSMPYDRLTVYLVAADERQRGVYQAAFLDQDALKTEIRKLLERIRFPHLKQLTFAVEIVDELPEAVIERIGSNEALAAAYEDGFYVDLSSRPATQIQTARLHGEHGLAHTDVLDILGKETVYLGRRRTVHTSDIGHHVNDFAFLDPTEPESPDDVPRIQQAADEERLATQTVHRRHAKIVRDGDGFRIFPIRQDLGSVTVCRKERPNVPIKVRPHVGLDLRDGDQIYLRRAIVRVELA